MMDAAHSVWLEVDLTAVEQNVRAVRGISGADLMAVVKANAYGYGAVDVAQAAVRGGATWLGVARVNEALELRETGFRQPILVLGMVPYGQIDACIAHNIHLPAGGLEAVEVFRQRAEAAGAALHLHLKVETGMGRLGVMPEEALALARRIRESPLLHLAGVFTHLANADRQDDPLTTTQISRFETALSALEENGFRPPWVHLANTAAALRNPLGRCNLVRCGQALVGHNSFSDEALHPAMRLAMRAWKSRLLHCYQEDGKTYGMVAAGYGDGYWRQRGNVVLVGGVRQQVTGLPGFDCMHIQLDRMYPVGSEVVLAGTQGEETITIQDLARRWGTGPGKITAVIPAHVPRLYVGQVE